MLSIKKIIVILISLSLFLVALAYFIPMSTFYYMATFTLTISLLFISMRYFFLSYFINICILIIMPIILRNFYDFLLKSETTHKSIALISWIFLLSIFNFLFLAYNIKNRPTTKVIKIYRKYNLHNLWLKYHVFLRIIAIFSLYIIILYSVLNTFAVLYSHLSAILNEGIEAEDGLISHLDALYFSATTFFTIGFGDITPSDYSEITKQLVIIQAIIGHILTTVLWPIVIIFVFSNKKKLSELWVPSSIEKP